MFAPVARSSFETRYLWIRKMLFMAIALNVGGINFDSKQALTERIRELIAKYPVGAKVSSEDKKFVESVFLFHPDAKRKLKEKIEEIEVRLDKYGKKHFFIYGENGFSENISWTKCVANARSV